MRVSIIASFLTVCLFLLTSCNNRNGFVIPNAGQIPALRTGVPILDATIGGMQQQGVGMLYQTIGQQLGDEIPLRLDASTAYMQVAPPVAFNPRQIDCSTNNANMPLPPGDYTCKVKVFCTKDSIHRPGRGVGYVLGRVQGKQAEAMSTMLIRGAFASIPHETLQTIAWSIQASIPVSQMPPTHQQIVNQLIPEYQQGLNGDFLQNFEAMIGTANFNALINQAGDVGKSIKEIRRSREIIRRNALNYDRLSQQVFAGQPGQETYTPAVPQISPWSEIRPGVFSQLIVEEGWQGLNTLNFRVLPNSNQNTNYGYSLNDWHFINASFNPMEQPIKLASAVVVPIIVVGDIFIDAAGATEAAIAWQRLRGFLNIGYGLSKTQALIMTMTGSGVAGNAIQVNERIAYKRRCTEQPPNGMSTCETAKWKLTRNKDCKKMREEYSVKWFNDNEVGHIQAIKDLEKSISNLEEFIRNNCHD